MYMQLKRNKMVIIEGKLYIYSWSLNDVIFNYIGSLIQIFKNKYSFYVFILQIFLSVQKSLCSIRDHNMWNQKN